MDSHRRVLGILYICIGTLQILAWLIFAAIASVIAPLIMNNMEPSVAEVIQWIFPFLRLIAALVVAFISIPSIITGIGLLNNKPWALTMALILGCLKLFSFPLGTALGLYSIWVYVESTRKPVAA